MEALSRVVSGGYAAAQTQLRCPIVDKLTSLKPNGKTKSAA
jgi:hypothetical protein